ncbi:hypothetical protein [Pseudoalteromonas sp. H103]|uniref:hypothetical protein n=1 Tax=Pseudoalteromonas sp. H103 TaxID=1761893 RepID=UPI0007323205|nr:hypothetical protein [Pseudoalteromonas sp. H103]KTF10002.1 hypothetical protein ATS74_12530 [Pseudoalteromonas sp. H103]
MLQLTVILILLIATTLLYCSNRHQRFLKKPISKHWRKLATLLFIAAIALAFYIFTSAAAAFFILLTVMLALMIVPFTSLFKSKDIN